MTLRRHTVELLPPYQLIEPKKKKNEFTLSNYNTSSTFTVLHFHLIVYLQQICSRAVVFFMVWASTQSREIVSWEWFQEFHWPAEAPDLNTIPIFWKALANWLWARPYCPTSQPLIMLLCLKRDKNHHSQVRQTCQKCIISMSMGFWMTASLGLSENVPFVHMCRKGKELASFCLAFM